MSMAANAKAPSANAMITMPSGRVIRFCGFMAC
jgi:hypothetical protein